MDKELTFIEKLVSIQSELKAPKGQWNKFSEYHYRSCEDILEAVKPLLKKHNLYQKISDEVVVIGDRFYIKATVTITDGIKSESSTAYARESLLKKGMDESQITGATSSYARKYALNAMYGIDDEKDADSKDSRQVNNENKPNQPQNKAQPAGPRLASQAQVNALKKRFPEKKDGWDTLTADQAQAMFNQGSK